VPTIVTIQCVAPAANRNRRRNKHVKQKLSPRQTSVSLCSAKEGRSIGSWNAQKNWVGSQKSCWEWAILIVVGLPSHDLLNHDIMPFLVWDWFLSSGSCPFQGYSLHWFVHDSAVFFYFIYLFNCNLSRMVYNAPLATFLFFDCTAVVRFFFFLLLKCDKPATSLSWKNEKEAGIRLDWLVYRNSPLAVHGSRACSWRLCNQRKNSLQITLFWRICQWWV
jgi:hypothetical protein